MATQEILLSTCDRCTTEVRSPLDRKRKKTELVLPPGWLHVSGNTATALVFEMDLCEECKQIVVEAAGKARMSHTTTSKAPDLPAKSKESKQGKQGADSEGLKLVEAG